MGNHDILYSPWRLKYILSEKDNKCIFCLEPDIKNDEKQLILYRSKHSFVIMNVFPYNNGHLMVVPLTHRSKLAELSNDAINDLFQTVQLTEKVIYNVYHPDGVNIGMNIGKAAGAGIDEHLHIHIIPRWIGDVNFMTSTNNTRIIPESFERAYGKLKEQFDNEASQK